MLVQGRQFEDGPKSRRPVVIAATVAVLAAASLLSWPIVKPVAPTAPQPSVAPTPVASSRPSLSPDPLVASGWHGYTKGHNRRFATEMLNPGSVPVWIHAVRLSPAPGVQIAAVGLADEEAVFEAFNSNEPLPPFHEVSLAAGESTQLYSAMDFDCASLSANETDQLTFELDITVEGRRLTQRLKFNEANEGWLTTLAEIDAACEQAD